MIHEPCVVRPTTRRLTEIEFCSWVAQALPGDGLEYHCGFLALDRTRGDIDKLAARALWAFKQGLVHLVQERVGPEDFAYIAVARRKPPRVPVASQLVAEAA